MENGKYNITINAKKRGVYPIYTKVDGKNIKNSPFSINVVAGEVDSANTVVSGKDGALDTWLVGDNEVLIHLRDKFENVVTASEEDGNKTTVEVTKVSKGEVALLNGTN